MKIQPVGYVEWNNSLSSKMWKMKTNFIGGVPSERRSPVMVSTLP